jgi:hypothetical protein
MLRGKINKKIRKEKKIVVCVREKKETMIVQMKV